MTSTGHSEVYLKMIRTSGIVDKSQWNITTLRLEHTPVIHPFCNNLAYSYCSSITSLVKIHPQITLIVAFVIFPILKFLVIAITYFVNYPCVCVLDVYNN